MTIQPDHKALIFIATVAVLGAGVRVVRASGRDSAPAAQPALERQQQAADSSARAGRGGAKARSRKTPTQTAADSTRRAAVRDSIKRAHSGPLDRPGYINGKLDLDVATAAQIDSLPGVTPLMARRIVEDRRARGPFLTRDGLRRVPGAGPLFVAQLDSLVVFSGTVVQPTVGDTVTPKRLPRRGTSRIKPPGPPSTSPPPPAPSLQPLAP